jgi:hypothetical protein
MLRVRLRSGTKAERAETEDEVVCEVFADPCRPPKERLGV